MAKCTFLGLGVMGFPMAAHLVKAGHEVTVYNRTLRKHRLGQRRMAAKARTRRAMQAQGAEFVFACVGNDDDLRSVCLGETGAFAGMDSGAVFVDHTTVSAKVTAELYKAADTAQISFVDAPISGGQAGAENGALSIMCGGDEGAYARAEPVMAAYSKMCRRIGESGAGQMTKMCNQIAIAGLVQGLVRSASFCGESWA